MAHLPRLYAAIAFCIGIAALFLAAFSTTIPSRQLDGCNDATAILDGVRNAYGANEHTFPFLKLCSFPRVQISAVISLTDASSRQLIQFEESIAEAIAGMASKLLPWSAVTVSTQVVREPQIIDEAQIRVYDPSDISCDGASLQRPQLVESAMNTAQSVDSTAIRMTDAAGGAAPSTIFGISRQALLPRLLQFTPNIDSKAQAIAHGIHSVFNRDVIIHIHVPSALYSPLVFAEDGAPASVAAQVADDSGILLYSWDGKSNVLQQQAPLCDSFNATVALEKLLVNVLSSQTAEIPFPRDPESPRERHDITACAALTAHQIFSYRIWEAAYKYFGQCTIFKEIGSLVIPEKVGKAIRNLAATLQKLANNPPEFIQQSNLNTASELVDVANYIATTAEVQFDQHLSVPHYLAVVLPPWAPVILPTILAIITGIKLLRSRGKGKSKADEERKGANGKTGGSTRALALEPGTQIRAVQPEDTAALRQLYRLGQMSHMHDNGTAKSHTKWIDHVLSSDFISPYGHYSALPVGGLWVFTISQDFAPAWLMLDSAWEDADGNIIIGCVGAITPEHQPAAAGEGTIELVRMVVHPLARRLGVGSKLVQHLTQWASEKGFQTIYLSTLASMETAVGLYLRNGFSYLGDSRGRVDVYDGVELRVVELIKRLHDDSSGDAPSSPGKSPITPLEIVPCTRITAARFDESRHQIDTIELDGLRVDFVIESREAGPLTAKSDETGRVRWVAGQLLAALLARHPDLVRDKNIIELGAGTGLLGSLAAKLGCRRALLTDANEAALQLALLNATNVADSRKTRTCAHVLKWNDPIDETSIMSLHPSFHVALASEVFYKHRGQGDIEQQAYMLCCSARRLLECACPTCMNDASQDQLDAPAVLSLAALSGILLIVYTPRYAGMASEIRCGVAAAGMHCLSLNREDIMTKAQRESLLFGRVRTVAVSRCKHVIQQFMHATGISAAAVGDDEDDWPEDDFNLANIAVDD